MPKRLMKKLQTWSHCMISHDHGKGLCSLTFTEGLSKFNLEQDAQPSVQELKRPTEKIRFQENIAAKMNKSPVPNQGSADTCKGEACQPSS